MGTKRELAPTVAEVICSAQDGAVLDLFSGMCSVGEAIGPKRQVWANDVQVFAYEVATALLTTSESLINPSAASDLLFDDFISHYFYLTNLLERQISIESDMLATTSFDLFNNAYSNLKNSIDIRLLQNEKVQFSLFTRTYSNTYFGLSQSIEIDAIRYAIEQSYLETRISTEQRRWLLISLGRAIIRSSNSTGHFAQFLKPKAGSYRTFINQRRRSIWDEWLLALSESSPIGNKEWRYKNRTYNENCLSLLPNLARLQEKPSVIYADPPYTDDQYSRYYHIFETLILYDYPEVTGGGLYRENRFRTPFSIKSTAIHALQELIKGVADLGSDIVLSYPNNGLVYAAGGDPYELLRKSFRIVECSHSIEHKHSTFGASKGNAKSSVVEQIFVGRS